MVNVEPAVFVVVITTAPPDVPLPVVFAAPAPMTVVNVEPTVSVVVTVVALAAAAADVVMSVVV